MPNQSRSPNQFALLIGVDCYLPNRLPNGRYYVSLRGCVRDVSHVEAFLRSTLKMPKENIVKLTATNTGATEPPEPPDQWPTYENMVKAFQRVTAMASPGDHVYIHYSGHGGGAPTKLPDQKGQNGIDEALVPTDIGNSEARYLRDVELAMFLDAMVKKDLVVAVVLDSCNSGGMARAATDAGDNPGRALVNAAVRGLKVVDTTPRRTDSLVASHASLAETWQRLTQATTREVSLGSGWLPEPKGYVLLAACRPSESAFEDVFDGKERNGALTYWLLDELQDLGPGLSYKLLHDRIVAKVHSQFECQTPQLQGEGDRAVFGSERVETHYAVNVIQVDVAKDRVLLNAGEAHGLRSGAQFAIFPRGTADYTNVEARQALVELTEVGATDSWAEIKKRFRDEAIEQGAQAVLLGAGSVKLVRQVSLVRQDDLPPSIDQDTALQAVERAISGGGWVEVVTGGGSTEYQVALNDKGEYEIWDRSGEVMRTIRPPLKAGDAGAAAGIVRRLEHLAKYHAVAQLDNHDRLSPLARGLELELLGKQADYNPADRPDPQAFDDPGHTPTIEVGEWTFLRIRNKSSRSLNVTVLDLQPTWSVEQVYPTGPGDDFVEFEAGKEEVLPLRAFLPEAYKEGTDILKVFATVGTSSFRWLELPPLDGLVHREAARAPSDPLEELLSALTADQPPTRALRPAAYPSKQWVTGQVELRIRRKSV